MKKILVILVLIVSCFGLSYIATNYFVSSVLSDFKTQDEDYTKSVLKVDSSPFNGLQEANQVQSTKQVQVTAVVQHTKNVQDSPNVVQPETVNWQSIGF